MVNFNRLPNFMIIGAPKTASTSLYDALQRHPLVFMSTKKEPNFFNVDKNYVRGIDWYLSFFSGAAAYPLRGEASVRYLDRSLVAAPRIKELYGLQPLRFVVIFRDPAERAYSGYWQAVRDGTEDLPFEEALAAEERWFRAHPNTVLVPETERKAFHIGRYATHLEPFLDRFDRSCFLFLLTEDFKGDFNAAVLRTFQFLGVEQQMPIERMRSNPAAMPRSRSLHRFLSTDSGIKSFLKRIMPSGLRSWIRRSNVREFRYAPLDPGLKNELHHRYFNEVQRLEKMIERDLSGWYPVEDKHNHQKITTNNT
jgi:hypothetical protein